jgi:DNA-directed RNA polymerase specialized sigma24 family protein
MEEVKVKMSLGQLLHDRRVRKINRAYAIYRLDSSENNLNDLLQEVIKLARRKLKDQAAEFGEVGMKNDDDYASRVVQTVWEKLQSFDDSQVMFYAWVMKIIENNRFNLYRHLLKSKKLHVPLVLQDEDGNEYDNPSVYTTSGSGLGTSFQVPEGLEEEEECICHLILGGRTYTHIAEILDVDVRTIKRRVKSLKDRFSLPIEEEEDVA